MSRKYTKIFSDPAYTARMPNASPSVVIAAGQQQAIRVKAPSEGRLTSLTIKQEETEAQVIFEVEILYSQLPYPVVNVDQPAATVPGDTLALYRVLPKQAGAAGFPIEIDEQADGFAYRNTDGNYTNNQRFIYIVIAPGGFGIGAGAESTWKIETTIESDVG
jgi:hypothetical protein